MIPNPINVTVKINHDKSHNPEEGGPRKARDAGRGDVAVSCVALSQVAAVGWSYMGA